MLTGGAAFAQILNTALSPVITRIYTPEEYGVLTLFTALLGIISAFNALSYDSAIPIADDDKKAINTLFLCIMILLFGTLAFAIILYFLGDILLALFQAEQLVNYKYLIPIGFFGTGLYTILTKWSFRKKNFGAITVTKYSQSIVGNATKIGLGLLSFGPVGLVLGRIIGQSVGIGTLASPLLKKEKNLLKKINKETLIWSAKRYVRFPLYTTPTLFFLSFSGQIPIIFISMLYGQEVVGLYGLAITITFLPMTLVGKSIEDVFYGEAASIGRNNPQAVKVLSNKILKKLILLGLSPMIILAIFGPTLFSFAFGSNWSEAGFYASLLTLYVFSHFIFHPISSIFFIFEKQKQHLVLNIINLLFVLTVFVIAFILSLNVYMTIIIFSIAKTFVEILKYILAQNILNKEIKSINL